MASQTTPHERTTLRTRPYWGKPMVNKPWISPAISGGGRTGHENISNKKKAAPRKTVVAVNFHQLKTSKHQHFPVALKKNGVRIPAPISTAKKKIMHLLPRQDLRPSQGLSPLQRAFPHEMSYWATYCFARPAKTSAGLVVFVSPPNWLGRRKGWWRKIQQNWDSAKK